MNSQKNWIVLNFEQLWAIRFTGRKTHVWVQELLIMTCL